MPRTVPALEAAALRHNLLTPLQREFGAAFRLTYLRRELFERGLELPAY